MGRFETKWLSRTENLAALSDLPGQWIDKVHQRRPPKAIVLDMDSSESPTYGEQEGSAYNGHFGCTCYHPLFVFNQLGDLERCAPRSGDRRMRCVAPTPASAIRRRAGKSRGVSWRRSSGIRASFIPASALSSPTWRGQPSASSPSTIHANAGDAQGGGAVVADQPAREADQDRREGRPPRPLRHIPNGRGRGAATDVSGNP